MPAMFAYDLPPSRRATTAVTPTSPVRVPMVSCWLGERDTEQVVAFCRARQLSLSSVISAVLLLAEWQLRGTPNIPVPYVYTVDLRYFLSPPGFRYRVHQSGGFGDLSRRDRPQDPGRRPRPRYRRDFPERPVRRCDRAVSASLQPQYIGNSAGMPDVVMHSDNGMVLPMRTPSDVELTRLPRRVVLRRQRGIGSISR